MPKTHFCCALTLLGFLFLFPFVTRAETLAADSKFLIIGTAANTHKLALAGLNPGDATASSLNIMADCFQTEDLRNAYIRRPVEDPVSALLKVQFHR